MARQETERKQMVADIASSKIDPNHMWHEAGTAGKITAGLAMLISGFGVGKMAAAGMSSVNADMKVIQDSIDRDIDAQKANLETKKSLLQDNYRKTGDLRLALAETRQHYNAVAEGQLQRLAAGQNSAEVQQRLQMANAAIDQHADQGAREIANVNATTDANVKNQNRQAAFALKAAAGAQAAQDKIPRETTGAKLANFDATIEELDNHLTNLEAGTQGPIAGTVATNFPWGGADTKANAAAADLLREKLASTFGGGAASDMRIRQAIASVPDPSDTPEQARVKISRIKAILTTSRDAYARRQGPIAQGGVGYRVGQAPPPLPPHGDE